MCKKNRLSITPVEDVKNRAILHIYLVLFLLAGLIAFCAFLGINYVVF